MLAVGLLLIISLTDALPIFASIGLRSKLAAGIGNLLSPSRAKKRIGSSKPDTASSLPTSYPATKETEAASIETGTDSLPLFRLKKNISGSFSDSINLADLISRFSRLRPSEEEPVASLNSFRQFGLGLKLQRFGFSDTTDTLFSPPPDSAANESLSKPPDFAEADTSVGELSSEDSLTIAMLQDTTTWEHQFRVKRKPRPYTSPVPPLSSAFFMKDKLAQRQVELDSLGETITISEKIGDYYVRPPVRLPMRGYKSLYFKSAVRNNFRELVAAQSALQSGDALDNVLKKITKLQIYIPGAESSFFTTLFGPPTVSLQVAGNVDINASYQIEEIQDPALVATNTNVRKDPNFEQQVRMSIKGMIGDKLSILADWDTQRPFEYENQLQIKYQGYPDDIIQSIEAGNVSLPLNTSLITSNQALFGIKAKMQLAGLSLTTIASQKRGKTETLTVAGGSQESKMDIRAWNYDYYKHFFLSNFFVTYWDKGFSKQEPLIQVPTNDGRQLGRIDVWVLPQQPPAANTPVNRAVALLTLGDIPYSKQNLENGFPFPDTVYHPLTPSQSADTLAKYRDPNRPEPKANGKTVVVGNFKQLTEGVDYIVDKSLGYISFLTQVNPGDAIAAAFEFSAQGKAPIKVGDFVLDIPSGTQRRLVLKLIKPPDMTSADTPSWILMLKNIYSLGAANVQQDGFELNVLYEQPGQVPPETPNLPSTPRITDAQGNERTLLNIVGLDRFDQTNNPTPDSKFDFVSGLSINPERGLLILPYQRPFSTQIRTALESASAPIGSFDYSEIYESEQYLAQRNGEKNRYIIRAKFKSTVQSSYNIGFNVVAGSVVVSTSSGRLTEGIDYTVDYQLGTVEILRLDAIQSGSSLSIQYERNELLSIASKTILGARAEYQFSENFKIGSTFLQYSERPLADKIRVGDEPVLNNIFGFDVQYKTESRWLTKLVDALPLISTKERSEFSVNAEYAQILPSHPTELNTKLDPGGVSYIDDFEGTKQIISLGKEFTLWELSSPPILFSGQSAARRLEQKALLSWYNYDRTDSRNPSVSEVFPQRQSARDQQTITPLVLDYYPNRRGAYNFSLDLKRSLYENPDSSWGGMMRLLPQYARKLEQSNAEFIEFWVRVDKLDAATTDNGYLYIDLGSVSEDILPNNELNTEDGMPLTKTPGTGANARDDSTRYGKDKYGRFLKSSVTGYLVNNILNNDPSDPTITEDIGIDGLTNDEEKSVFSAFITEAEKDLSNNTAFQEELRRLRSDPSGDDFFAPEDNNDSFDYINGVEGNSKSGRRVTSNRPNTEDLNNNNTSDRNDNFYRYKIPINPRLLKDPNGPIGKYVVGGGINTADVTRNGGFVLFRVPLKSFSQIFGVAPSFNNIMYARVWVSGFRQPHKFEFASLDFIGSQWFRAPSSNPDPFVSLSAINLEENSSRYAIPPGIERARDRTRPDENILANEQSIVITGRKISKDTSRAVSRDFTFGGNGINLNPYKRLKAFIHGGFKTDGLQAFIRFGNSETNNYYEYRIPIKQSPDNYEVPSDVNSPAYEDAQRILWPAENEIDIDLKELPTVKFGKRDSLGFIKRTLADGKEIVVKGSPSLGGIRYMVLGLRNPGTKKTYIDSAEVWFNELRASGYDEKNGWAARATATLKLADFMTLNGAIEKRTADFHAVDVRLNPLISQNDTRNWSVAGTVNLDKLLPAEDGWQIPLSVEHTENLSVPKYSPNETDVLLDRQVERAIADTLANGATEDEAKSYGESIRQAAITLTVTNRISLPTIQKTKPSDFWLTRYTLDRLNLNYNYTITNLRSPSEKFNEAWSWQAGMAYGLQVPANSYYIEPLGFLSAVPLLNTYKDFRFYYLPQSYKLQFGLLRARSQSQPRSQETPLPFNTALSSTRGLNLNYKVTETFDVSYTSRSEASLNNLLVTEPDSSTRIERSSSEVYDRLFRNLSRFDFGNDRNFSQNVNLNWKPKLIAPLKWISLNVSYTSQYGWTNPNPDRINEQGNTARTNTNFQIQSVLNFRELLEGIGIRSGQTRSESDNYENPNKKNAPDSLSGKKESSSLSDIVSGIGTVFSTLTRFDQLNIGYSLGNSLQNGGVAGGPGWFNFFPFNQIGSSNGVPAPSFGYQMGLSDNFGERVSSPLQFTDISTQTNTVNIGTSWTPVTNFKVDFLWQTSWNFNEQSVIDSTGNATQVTQTGSIQKSYIALFRDINDFRKALLDENGNIITDRETVARSFESSFEPTGLGRFTGRIFSLNNRATELLPLPNWRITWSGLESWPVFEAFARTATLTHAYTANYTSSFTQSQDQSGRQVQASGITEQFAPLVGLSITWKFGLNSTFSYNKSRDIRLNPGSNSLSQTRSSQFSIALNYQKRGLKIPFFARTYLENAINITFTFSLADEEQQTFLFEGEQNLPVSGTTRLTLEPRIGYELSSNVSASFFWRYNQIKPKSSGSNIYESTKQEIGFNFRITIGSN
ncbi:MAG: cell surface protein SprA [Chlorobiales bacterium]|nr:cell surface protein SprA [Chlorobiales bacterium]